MAQQILTWFSCLLSNARKFVMPHGEERGAILSVEIKEPPAASHKGTHAGPMARWSRPGACAFRLKCMLESGEFATIADLAERGGIAPVPQVLRPAPYPALARHRQGDP